MSKTLIIDKEFKSLIPPLTPEEDVEVMCLQMRLIYGVDGIEQARAEKVARLHGRLKP